MMLTTILYIASGIAFIGIIVGITKPSYILFFATHKFRKNNLYAFGLSLSFFLFFTSIIIAIQPNTDWVVWIFTMFFLSCVGNIGRIVTTPQTQTNNEVNKRNSNNSSKSSATTIESFSDDSKYNINTNNITCSCPDFTKTRKGSPKDSPGRLCKHLVRIYAEDTNSIPSDLQEYKKLISGRANENRGMPYNHEIIFAGQVQGEALILSYNENSYPWMNVFYSSARYGYSLLENRWSYDKAPKHKDSIIDIINNNLGTINEDDMEHEVHSLEEWASFNTDDQFEPSFEEDIKPLIEKGLGYELPTSIEHVERSAYFILYKENPKNWICRVHFGKNDISSVELKNKQKLKPKANGELYKSDCVFLKKAFEEVAR